MGVLIYELIDPLTDITRYIGRTMGSISGRLSNHISEAKGASTGKYHSNHRTNWINSLIKLNVKPIINVIDEVDEENWQFWEKFYIGLYKSWNINLVNGTPGGDGFHPGHIPWCKGLTKSTDYRLKIISEKAKLQKGKKLSDVTKKKMSDNKKGKRPPYMKDGIPKKALDKMSKSWFKKGHIPWTVLNCGKIESKKRLPIVQFDIFGKLIREWDHCKQAADFYNRNTETIRNCCNKNLKILDSGKLYISIGYIWKYKHNHKL